MCEKIEPERLLAYKVYAPGGVYFSLEEIEEDIPFQRVYILLPAGIRFFPAAGRKDSPYFLVNGMKIPASSFKTLTKKGVAVPYLRAPYGYEDIFLKVEQE